MLRLATCPRWSYTTTVRCERSGVVLARLSGDARVRVEASGGVTVEEAGVWESSSPGLPAVGTRATTRWRCRACEGDGVRWRVEHLRRARPTHLLDLEQDSPGRWVSVVPHPCAEDTYELEADTTDPDGVTLAWTVRGPEKAHVLTTRYTPA